VAEEAGDGPGDLRAAVVFLWPSLPLHIISCCCNCWSHHGGVARGDVVVVDGGGGGDDDEDDEHCGQPHWTAADMAAAVQAVPAAGSGRTGSGFHMTCCACSPAGPMLSGLTSRAMGRLMTAAAVDSSGGGGSWAGGDGVDDDVDDSCAGLGSGGGSGCNDDWDGRSAC